MPIVCDCIKEVGEFTLYGLYFGSSNKITIGRFSMSANTISWYSENSEQAQLNMGNKTYPYVAIG